MAESLKVLAQLVPSPTTLTNFYTVPAATTATASSFLVCNQNASVDIVFRLSVAVGGATDDPSQYLYFDLALGSNDTFVATIGISLGTGDVVRIQSSAANVSFNLFGVEVS